MTIAQYLPQWLRSKLQKPATQNTSIPGKEDRQILPTMPKPQRPPVRFQDDDSSNRFRIYWRM
jgi:hypothetical protein